MNRFASLMTGSDDEDEKFTATTGEQKPPKKTHQQRKQIKESKIKEAELAAKQPAPASDELPERLKEDPRKKRYHEIIPPKDVPATGHYLDRRSGTGRVDKPRKEGGGRGGIGNLHDELQKDKYIKEGEENNNNVEATEETTAEQKEPEKPQGITLDEYYRNKGIELDTLTAAKKEAAVKKGEVNAEWIKKEKLTVLQTKEDKKAEEEESKDGKKGRKQNKNKVGMAENLNSELFGFNAAVQPKPAEQPREPREHREPRQPRQHREPRQPRQQKEHRQPRQPREQRQPRQPREQRQPRQPRDNNNKQHREPREPRDNNNYNKERRDNQHHNNRDNNYKGGNRGANKEGSKKPQEKVSLNLDDFPTL